MNLYIFGYESLFILSHLRASNNIEPWRTLHIWILTLFILLVGLVHMFINLLYKIIYCFIV